MKIGLPIMLGGVAQNLVTVIDTMFLSQYGEVQLGAAGNAGILYFIFATVGLGYSTGAQIIIGRRNGENDSTSIQNVFNQSFLFLTLLSILLLAVMLVASPFLLKAIIASDSIYAESVNFIQYRSIGLPFAYMTFAMQAFFIGIKRTKIITYTTVVLAVVNIFLDYALIFGNFGLPELGIKGAAIATSIADISAFIFILTYTRKCFRHTKYKLFQNLKWQSNLLKDILKISFPTMIQNLITLGSWFIFFSLIEQLGEDKLAISHIIRSIYMVIMIPMFGLSQATSTIVSNLIGENKNEQVLSSTFKVLLLSILCSIPFAIANLLFPNEIISLYTDNSVLAEGCLNTLNVITLSMFFFCFAYILFSAVSGTGNTRTALYIEFINLVIYLSIAFIVILEYRPRIEYVWCTEFVYFGFLGIMSFIYLKSKRWIGKKI